MVAPTLNGIIVPKWRMRILSVSTIIDDLIFTLFDGLIYKENMMIKTGFPAGN